ncbi:MAG: MBL fold metallo-hydrolase [Bacteroidia bacterium]|nr:MBL fold metallo-hydrolase [Bacteroidia bacterium]
MGSFVCDGDGNCGRGLGRYQYMSYRSDVRQTISQQEGGAAFLARVDSGAAISEAEVAKLLSEIDLVVITHIHPNHWHKTAPDMMAKDQAIACQPADEAAIQKMGFTQVQAIEDI